MIRSNTKKIKSLEKQTDLINSYIKRITQTNKFEFVAQRSTWLFAIFDYGTITLNYIELRSIAIIWWMFKQPIKLTMFNQLLEQGRCEIKLTKLI